MKENPWLHFAGRNTLGVQGQEVGCLALSVQKLYIPGQDYFKYAMLLSHEFCTVLEIFTFGHPNNESQTAAHAQH